MPKADHSLWVKPTAIAALIVAQLGLGDPINSGALIPDLRPGQRPSSPTRRRRGSCSLPARRGQVRGLPEGGDIPCIPLQPFPGERGAEVGRRAEVRDDRPRRCGGGHRRRGDPPAGSRGRADIPRPGCSQARLREFFPEACQSARLPGVIPVSTDGEMIMKTQLAGRCSAPASLPPPCPGRPGRRRLGPAGRFDGRLPALPAEPVGFGVNGGLPRATRSRSPPARAMPRPTVPGQRARPSVEHLQVSPGFAFFDDSKAENAIAIRERCSATVRARC